MGIKGVCFGWETTTPVARTKASVAGQKSWDARAKGSGTGAKSPPRSPTGCWRAVTPPPDHNHARRLPAGS